MKVKRTETGFLIVLDVGDEIVESLKRIALSERIGLASIQGIGAVREAVVGCLDPDQKQYIKRQLGSESRELLSLLGNMALLEGEPFVHAHVVLSDREMRTFGGHLFEATTSATVEIFMRVFEGEASRQFDPDCGANLLTI
jgi:uncharacterized protein